MVRVCRRDTIVLAVRHGGTICSRCFPQLPGQREVTGEVTLIGAAHTPEFVGAAGLHVEPEMLGVVIGAGSR
jgi:hypothetical protein